MDYHDSLEFLVALQRPRLCQMLAVLSQQQEPDHIWGLLLWIEAERERLAPQLPPGPRLRLQRELLVGGSLESFSQLDRPCALEVFQLIAETVLQPLLGVHSEFPDHELVSGLLGEWTLGKKLGDRVVGFFLDELPAPLYDLTVAWLPLGFARSKRPQARLVGPRQRAPFLLEIFLYLLHRGYLSAARLINLYTPAGSGTTSEQRLLAEGVLAFWEESSRMPRETP